jgi:hypothetical protein
MSLHEITRSCRFFLFLLLLIAVSSPPAMAQDETDLTTLIEALETRFRVVLSGDRYVLTPREDDTGFNLVETLAGEVMVDGEPISLEGLRAVLGGDAELVLQLAERQAGDGSGPDIEALERQLGLLRETNEARREKMREIEESLEEAREDEPRRHREHHHHDTRMSFGNSLLIRENESTYDVVVLGGDLEMLGEVRGDTVVVGGSAKVSGELRGDLTVIGGPVLLGPRAKINGEVVSIGGRVESDPESFVRGGITELDLGPVFGFEDFDWSLGNWLGFLWPGSWFQFGWNDTYDLIGHAIFLALIMMLLVFVARGLVERVARRADREPWKSALVGLLVQILIGPVVFLLFVLLMVSVVGIPLAVMLLPLSLLALLIFFLVGYAGVATVAGGWLKTRFDLADLNPYAAVLLGMVLIQGWSILGEALSFVGGPIQFAAVLLIILGFVLKYSAWTTGLGAVVLHTFSPDPPLATNSVPPLPPRPTSNADAPDNPEDTWSAGDVDDHAEWEEAARKAEAEENSDDHQGAEASENEKKSK